MLVDRDHQISGTHTVERVIRFRRPAFVVETFEDFCSVVKGACGLSGGMYCHLIPAPDGKLAEGWTEYIQRLCPDDVHVPGRLRKLKIRLKGLTSGRVRDVDYSDPVSWVGSPALHSFLAKRNSDGSPAALGPSCLVDVERTSEAPAVSDLQCAARLGIVPEIPKMYSSYEGVRDELWELVHTVAPASGQGLVNWLFSIPKPDRTAPSPPYLTDNSYLHSPLSLSHIGIQQGAQSFPPDHRDSPLSNANRLVVVGEGDSLQDACLFWNLRANRWIGKFPVWVTPEQAELPEVREAIVLAGVLMSTGFGAPSDGVDDLHLLSATLDTHELAKGLTGEVRAAGSTPTEWINFIGRNYRPYFRRSVEAATFSGGQALFVVGDDELPCPRPTQITIDLEIVSFRPPPTEEGLVGTNVPHTGRFGEASLPLNFWHHGDSSAPFSLGYRKTFEIVRSACEAAGLRPSFDRKASLTYGLNQVLAGEHSSHIILRNHAVLELIRHMVLSERDRDESERHLTPKGIPFGDAHRIMKGQSLASALVSWLLEKGLIFRGLDLECRDCGTNAWYSLNDVGNQFKCVGCQGMKPFDGMTQDASWRFRINQLLASALDQGALPQALAAYDMDLGPPFTSRAYVFPNVILTDLHTGDHLAEIDLLGFEDGEWLAAECKSRGDATQAELEALREILNKLGGGRLLLVRASTASEECDKFVDRVIVWDYQPMRRELVGLDQLGKLLGSN